MVSLLQNVGKTDNKKTMIMFLLDGFSVLSESQIQSS